MGDLVPDDGTPEAFDKLRGFDDVELETCLKVLRALGNGVSDASDANAAAVANDKDGTAPSTSVHPTFHHKTHKPLRVALQPLLGALRTQLGSYGGDAKAFRASKQAKRDLNRRKMQEKAFDREARNKTAMRAERLAKLSELERGQVDAGALDDSDDTHATRVDTLQLTDKTSGVRIPMGVPDGCSGKSAAYVSEDDEEKNEPTTLHQPRQCYTCKVRYRELHHFYAQLCPPCAALNWGKRRQTADLSGRVILITGSRVKIGYRITLKLLRCGAVVVATTRFPVDARRRFLLEPDSGKWADRLTVVAMDLRDLPGLELLCEKLQKTLPRLDAIVNNACQTVRRPPAYYEHLLEAEAEGARAYLTGSEASHASLGGTRLLAGVADEPTTSGTTEETIDRTSEETTPSPPTQSSSWQVDKSELNLKASGWMAPSAAQTQLQVLQSDSEQNSKHFPTGHLDVNEQQIDLRPKTSWTTKLGEVETPELLEVLAVNAAAPFVLNGKLRGILARTAAMGVAMSESESSEESKDSESNSKSEENKTDKKTKGGRSFIVNVSAMEGKFYRHKTPNHPHTNMAKAALNMMTATSAFDYSKDGIYMNAVDTGWINDENPVHVATRIAKQHEFQTPIDEEDAAARCVAPILEGVNGDTGYVPPFGKFFKDYKESEW